MTFFVVDIEADGPCPGLFSMIELGAVRVCEKMDEATFFSTLRPITDRYEAEALASIGKTREETLTYDDPEKAIIRFSEWVQSTTQGRPIFLSDNNGFDWSFVNYYFTYFLGVRKNPFGHSSRRIGDIYGGMMNDLRNTNWKRLRKTRHTHNALDDAMGNAQAFVEILKLGNFKQKDEYQNRNRTGKPGFGHRR